jgi:hypothetical protein
MTLKFRLPSLNLCLLRCRLRVARWPGLDLLVTAVRGSMKLGVTEVESDAISSGTPHFEWMIVPASTVYTTACEL